MFFWDSSFLMLIPVLIFAMYAQYQVKSVYNKYKKVPSLSGFDGRSVAEKILADNNINEVEVELTKGKLSDHYDPANKKLRLSHDIYYGKSVADLGIAAHEAGHAIQYAKGYSPVQFRGMIYPVANFGSSLAFPLFFIGLFFFRSKFLMDLGILLYIGAVVFTLVALPVEFDASKRAIFQLEDGSYLNEEESYGAKKVLNAAALTYVAAAAVAVMHLIRLLILRED